jgi:hypothetical protein
VISPSRTWFWNVSLVTRMASRLRARRSVADRGAACACACALRSGGMHVRVVAPGGGAPRGDLRFGPCDGRSVVVASCGGERDARLVRSQLVRIELAAMARTCAQRASAKASVAPPPA